MALLPFANAAGGSGGSGTVTSISVATANGFSGTVSNPTTTPAITIIAGAITPTSVNGVTISGSSTPTLAVTGTSSISGANTGDQTITLTSDVTGSGTGSFATTIRSSVALAGSPTTTTQASTDNSTKIATTAYVTTGISNAIAGVNPAIAVQVATTAAGDTSGLTYNNGVSGVGATLTGSNNTAITIDGVTFTAVGQRLLVKNDTQSPSGAFNGIYTLTALQTVGVAPVFTRASDYNSSSDINNTGAIPVVNGTANALTSWLLTSAVTTVGTDPLTYTKFSVNPTTEVIGPASATDSVPALFDGTSGKLIKNSIPTGTGNPVLATSPTIATPTVTGTLATSAGYTYDIGTAGAPWNNIWLGFSANIQNSGINTEIIAGANGTNQILTLPLGTDTIVARNSADTMTNKLISDAFMGNAFLSQSATLESITLLASTNYTYDNLLEIGATKTLEIPATSTLEVESYVDQAYIGNTLVSAPDANNTFMSQSRTQQNIILPSVQDFLVDGLLEVGIGYNFEIPATSSLEVQNSGAISYPNLTSNIFGSLVQSAPNAGSALGTIYWINLGGLKLMWGIGTAQTVNTNTTFTFTIPNASFFTNVWSCFPGNVSATNVNYAFVVNFSSSQVQVQLQSTASISAQAEFFMIGN